MSTEWIQLAVSVCLLLIIGILVMLVADLHRRVNKLEEKK